MITGAVVVIIWITWVKPQANINELFGMYEIIPGFLASVIVTYLVSKYTKKPGILSKKTSTGSSKLLKNKYVLIIHINIKTPFKIDL